TAFGASSGHVQWQVRDQRPGAADAAIVLSRHSSHRTSQFNGLDTASGKRRWSVGEGAGSPPSLVDGVTVVSEGRSLQALDAHTGTRRWTAALPPANGASGTRIHGSLYM